MLERERVLCSCVCVSLYPEGHRWQVVRARLWPWELNAINQLTRETLNCSERHCFKWGCDYKGTTPLSCPCWVSLWWMCARCVIDKCLKCCRHTSALKPRLRYNQICTTVSLYHLSSITCCFSFRPLSYQIRMFTWKYKQIHRHTDTKLSHNHWGIFLFD